MSFLATRASAQDDACGSKCGTVAECVVAADGTGACECVDGSTFNQVDNTCDGVVVDACGNKCGTVAECVVAADGTGGACKCLDNSTFSDLDNTCDGVVDATVTVPAAAAAAAAAAGSGGDVCANKECGTDAECVVTDLGAGVCQCFDGSTFSDLDKTCDGVAVDPCATVMCEKEFLPVCMVVGGKGVCDCGYGYVMENGVCIDPCSRVDCGSDGGVYQVNGDGVPECVCFYGLDFDEFDMSCYGPFLQTTVQLQLQAQVNGRQRKYAENVNFTTDVPAERASGSTACTDLSSNSSLHGDTKITVGNPGCTDKPGLTIERPVKNGRSYGSTERIVKGTDLPRSVGCEITTCHKDCGAAECVVKDGKPQCRCPWGFVFNEAEKNCTMNPTPINPTDNPCKTGTLKCDKNSMCVVKNGQGTCQCNAGYTKTNGLCTAMCKPACPAKAQCTVVGGKAQCRCKAGYTMDKSKSQCT
ncbi:unnamed protein product, partial [Closterium sp. Yama58-4]